MSAARAVHVINPLGAALAHYLDEVRSVLAPVTSSVDAEVFLEPSASGRGGHAWLRQYAAALARARRLPSSTTVLVLWPVVGYLDLPLARLLAGGGKVWLVVHDPSPLVHARGYGALARRLASTGPVDARVMVHSQAAADVVRRELRPRSLAVVPHPMLPPRPSASRRVARPVIRVLGQFKADRDVAALERLAREGPGEWTYEIVGRGWPAVAGWHVDARFVPEAEFEELLTTSSAVLIPYRRFFQSGVAVRAVELGTPVVGPADSSLADLLGTGSPWLVRDGDWRAATTAALGDASALAEIAERAHRHVVAGWRDWLASA